MLVSVWSVFRVARPRVRGRTIIPMIGMRKVISVRRLKMKKMLPIMLAVGVYSVDCTV